MILSKIYTYWQQLLAFLILLLLCSCQHQIKAKFTITNKVKYNLDSVQVQSAQHKLNTHFIQLKPGETKIYYLDMTHLPKTDGSYLLTYKPASADTLNTYRFGYYTNGAPLENNIFIQVYADTIICEYDYYTNRKSKRINHEQR